MYKRLSRGGEVESVRPGAQRAKGGQMSEHERTNQQKSIYEWKIFYGTNVFHLVNNNKKSYGMQNESDSKVFAAAASTISEAVMWLCGFLRNIRTVCVCVCVLRECCINVINFWNLWKLQETSTRLLLSSLHSFGFFFGSWYFFVHSFLWSVVVHSSLLLLPPPAPRCILFHTEFHFHGAEKFPFPGGFRTERTEWTYDTQLTAIK